MISDSLALRRIPPQLLHLQPHCSGDLLERGFTWLLDALHLRISGLRDADAGCHLGLREIEVLAPCRRG